MWVLAEGLTSLSNVSRIGVLQPNDGDILEQVIDKGAKIIKDDPDSLPFIKKYADVKVVRKFLKGVISGEFEDLIVLVFYNKENTLSGASLVSRGRPWYAPEGVTFLNEECTVAFQKGLGLSRAMAYALENMACTNVRLLAFSNANTLNNKMLENTYEKHLGYSSYKTFYKEI
jgi:hypothetical protein